MRRALLVIAAFALVVVASFAPFVPSGGLHQLYERTLGFQLTRSDLYSIWGLHPSLGWLKTIVQITAVMLSIGVAFVARRRSLAAISALACAVTIALQLGAEHWFYNYLVWIAPLALVALLAREPAGDVMHAAEAPRARTANTVAAGA